MNTNQNASPSPEITPPPTTAVPKPKRRRNGFIASLPKRERDLVNQMLFDGTPYRGIVYALDELGHEVTERNISNWARGGHQDWLREQERIHEHHCRQDRLIDLLREDDATNLPEVGLQVAATALSELLTQCSLQPADKKPDLAKYLQIIRTLCRLTRELYKLQEYRDENSRRLGRKHSPEEIKKHDDEFFEDLKRDFSKSGLAQIDAEIAADNPNARLRKDELPRVPDPNEPRPGESLTVTVMRQFLEQVRARKKESSPAQPPPVPATPGETDPVTDSSPSCSPALPKLPRAGRSS